MLVIARLDGVVPEAKEIGLSQLVHASFGSGRHRCWSGQRPRPVLLLAANTSCNDFLRMMFLIARDFRAPSFLRRRPAHFPQRHHRPVPDHRRAIYAAFPGNIESFTLSQAVIVVHWSRHRDQAHFRRRLGFNPAGAC